MSLELRDLPIKENRKVNKLEFTASFEQPTAFATGVAAVLEQTTILYRTATSRSAADSNSLMRIGEQEHTKMSAVDEYLKQLKVPLSATRTD